MVDDISNTTGNVGDKIGYRFSFKAKTTNTASITDAMINQVQLSGLGAPSNVVVTVGGKAATGTLVKISDNIYAIKIDTPIKAGQEVTVTFDRTTEGVIANFYMQLGFLKSVSLTTQPGGADVGDDGNLFNPANLTLKAQNNTATIQQFIRNPRTNPKDQAWFGPGYGDGKAEITAAPGDEITYLFKIQLPTDANGKYTNDAALLNAALKDISMNKPDDMTLVDLDTNGTKVQIDYATSPIEHRVNVNSLADLKDVALLSPLDTTNKTMMSSTGVVKVQYRAKVNANAPAQDVTNDANFYASNLTGDLKDQTIANYQQKTKANQSIVHIQGKKEVTIKQQIKNVFNPSENVSDPDDPKHQDTEGYSIETSGTKDDVIAYRFTVKAAKDNTGDITGLKVNNIKLDQPTKLTHTDDTSNQPYTLTVAIKNADNSSAGTDTGATFSASYDTITLTKPLKPGQTVTITYMMKITAEIDETPTGNNVVHNDGELTADELTKSVTVGTVTNNEALKPDADGGKMTFNATILNLEKAVGKITIRYVDLDNLASDINNQTWLAPSVTATGKIDTPFSTGKYADGTVVGNARVAPKLIKNAGPNSNQDYTIIAVTEATELKGDSWSQAYKDDPKFAKTDRIITYGYKKRMIGIEAPKYWDFGNYNRTQTEQTYYLDPKGTPQKVTVYDNYGVKNWQLQVKQEQQFKDNQGRVLKDAQLRFKHGKITKDTVMAEEVDSRTQDTLTSIDHFELIPGAATEQNLMSFEKQMFINKTISHRIRAVRPINILTQGLVFGTITLVTRRPPVVVSGFTFQQQRNEIIQLIRLS